MSGTNHSIKIEHSLQPRMILVRPQMGENIGAAARAMWNFGLEHMVLVAPRDGWPNPAAQAMASGAARVLDQVIVRENLEDSVADLDHVFATTARERGLTKEVVSPKEAMRRAKVMIARGEKPGFLFGPERAGLENEDVVKAQTLISVPVNPAYGSLNLAQCVLLLSYEWMLQGENLARAEDVQMKWADAVPATQKEREVLQEKLEARLEAVGFFWPEDKAQSMRLSLRNMFARMPLSNVDIRSFHGIFRALSRDRELDRED